MEELIIDTVRARRVNSNSLWRGCLIVELWDDILRYESYPDLRMVFQVNNFSYELFTQTIRAETPFDIPKNSDLQILRRADGQTFVGILEINIDRCLDGISKDKRVLALIDALEPKPTTCPR